MASAGSSEAELSWTSISQASRVYQLHGEYLAKKKIIFKKPRYIVTPAEEMPESVRALCDGTMRALETNGDGACALHAVFGQPTSSGELFLANARDFAARLLGPSPDELVNRGVQSWFVDSIKTVLWADFAVPYYEGRRDAESILFVEALEETLPALAREARETYDASKLPPFAITNGPPDFVSRAWPAYLHCIQKSGYYFSVEELLVICAQKDMNVAVFTEAGGQLTYESGHFSGAEPLVCAKLTSDNVERVRSHFERIVASSEVERLTQAAPPAADEHRQRLQNKRRHDYDELYPQTHSRKSKPTAGEQSGATAGAKSDRTAGQEKGPATGDMKETVVGTPRLARMDCLPATGPDISNAEFQRRGPTSTFLGRSPVVASMKEGQSDSSEEGEMAEDVYFAVRARDDTLRFSEQDQWAACWQSLAQHLRDRPTLPASWEDADKSFTDVDSAVRLPLCSCPFKQCIYSCDSRRDFLLHIGGDGPHRQIIEEVCGKHLDHFSSLDFLAGSFSVIEREHFPLIGMATTRRALRTLPSVYNDDVIKSLVCFVCGQIHSTAPGPEHPVETAEGGLSWESRKAIDYFSCRWLNEC